MICVEIEYKWNDEIEKRSFPLNADSFNKMSLEEQDETVDNLIIEHFARLLKNDESISLDSLSDDDKQKAYDAYQKALCSFSIVSDKK